MEPKIKNNTTLKMTVVLTILFAVTTGSYLYFSSYQTKMLKKIEEVKGIKKTNSLEFLYPESAQVVSLSQTKRGSQSSYVTQQTQDYIQVFYKNLFVDLGWEEVSIKKSDTSLVYKFKKEERTATVIAQREEQDTLVNVEISSQ